MSTTFVVYVATTVTTKKPKANVTFYERYGCFGDKPTAIWFASNYTNFYKPKKGESKVIVEEVAGSFEGGDSYGVIWESELLG